ncbi:ABC transporter permease [Catellatospora aurea]|uniref:ABC transporter permease n=1 Tax=Catellatospora aurea TaxID=1337874 RepID=A0ABW2GXQ8_9ACTN
MAAAAHTSPRDVFAQAWHAIVGRRGRSFLTAAGVGLGVAATIATLAVTATASGAISDKFDATRATSVTLRWPERVIRPDTGVIKNVTRLNGVEAAGLICEAARDEHRATAVTPQHATGVPTRIGLLAAQPSAFSALRVAPVSGRFFDEGHGTRADQVVVVDTVAAQALGVSQPGQLIYVDGAPVSVIGVYEAPVGEARMTAAVIMPYQRCLHDSPEQPLFGQPMVVVQTALGAADQVAGEARLALYPADPGALEALVPPDLRTFREGVEDDTRALFLGLALVSLVIGALGVSNTTLVSVLERRPEIGLRRAIGASRSAVAGQFLVESGLLGLVGGILGTVVAVDAAVAVALVKQWVVVLDPVLLGGGPLLGLLVGTAAGVYPAWKASRVEPAASLRAS